MSIDVDGDNDQDIIITGWSIDDFDEISQQLNNIKRLLKKDMEPSFSTLESLHSENKFLQEKIEKVPLINDIKSSLSEDFYTALEGKFNNSLHQQLETCREQLKSINTGVSNVHERL